MEIKNKIEFLEDINKIKNYSEIREAHYRLMNLSSFSKKRFSKD
jgi:hypothetical protein